MNNEIQRSISNAIEQDNLKEALNLLQSWVDNTPGLKKTIKANLKRKILLFQDKLLGIQKSIYTREDSVENLELKRNEVKDKISELLDEIKIQNYIDNNAKKGGLLSSKNVLFGILALVIAIPAFIFLSNAFTVPTVEPEPLEIAEEVLEEETEESLEELEWELLGDQFIGRDFAGRRGKYIRYYLPEYNWMLGEVSTTLNQNGRFDICEVVQGSGIPLRINRDSLNQLIVFGNTSYEENLSLPLEARLSSEEQRAELRGRILAECISELIEPQVPVFMANLGKYLYPSDSSAWQREVVILGVLKEESGINTEEALFSGLEQELRRGKSKVDIRNYSHVDSTGRLLDLERLYN